MATQNEIADHLDLSERQVRNLLQDGVLPSSSGRGGYSIDDCRVAYIRYLRGVKAGQVKPEPDDPFADFIDLDRERAMNLRADTRLKEIKERQLNRELAPIQSLEWILGRVGAQVSAILESIPLKVKRRLPKLNATEIEIIKREIVKCQNIASRITVHLDEYRHDPGTGSRDPESDPAGAEVA